MALPSVAEMEAYIRRKALEMGIDPDVAVAVAKGEGLAPDTWQSNLEQPYGREASYGPFQLHVDPTGKRPGMGNDFMAATGLNPANPDTWDEGVDYALGRAKEGGWSPWMGAKAKGITGFMGIGGEPAAAAEPAQATQAASYSAGEYVPTFDYEAPDLPTPGLLDDPAGWMDENGTGLAKMGLKVLGKAAKKKSEAEPLKPLTPPVMQPLGRYTLKGLI